MIPFSHYLWMKGNVAENHPMWRLIYLPISRSHRKWPFAAEQKRWEISWWEIYWKFRFLFSPSDCGGPCEERILSGRKSVGWTPKMRKNSQRELRGKLRTLKVEVWWRGIFKKNFILTEKLKFNVLTFNTQLDFIPIQNKIRQLQPKRATKRESRQISRSPSLTSRHSIEPKAWVSPSPLVSSI